MRTLHTAVASALAIASLAGFGSLSAAQQAGPPQREWELVRSVSNPLGGTIDLVLLPEHKSSDHAYYLEIANAVCGKRTTCMVNFWTDRAHIPKSAEMPVVDLRLMTATYERHPSYAAPVLHLACRLYPNKETGEREKCFYAPGLTPEVDTAPAAAEQGEGKSTVPKRIFVFAGFGLVGIVGGILALRATGKFATLGPAPQQWRRFRVAALAIGIVGGIATYPLTYWMGYPVTTREGVWRIVGIPFFVAFFDSGGADYVGAFTLPNAVANVLFWFVFPQIILILWGCVWRKRRAKAIIN